MELLCPWRDFLEKKNRDPKLDLVSMDLFSRACDFFRRLVRSNVNMEPYGKRGGGVVPRLAVGTVYLFGNDTARLCPCIRPV